MKRNLKKVTGFVLVFLLIAAFLVIPTNATTTDNSVEQDLAELEEVGGVPQESGNAGMTAFAADDYGNTIGTAYGWVLTPGRINTRSGMIETALDFDYFWFTAPTSGTYTFYTTGRTNMMGYLFNSSQTQIAYNDNISTSDLNFRITYNLTANQVYYLGVKAYGLTTGSYSLNISVPAGAVTINPTSISLNKTSTSLVRGGSETLSATVLPTTATNKTVTWTTSNSNVATVNSYGTVTGVNAGTTTITARTSNGYVAYCTVTVYGSDDYGNRFEDAYGWALTAGRTNTRSGVIETNGDWDYFWFTAPVTGDYTIYTTGSTDTMGYLFNSYRIQTAFNDNASSSDLNFRITYNLTANQVYYLAVRAYSSNVGSYNLNITVPTGVITVNPTSISLNKTSTTLARGGLETLTATVYPSNATDKTVTWITSNSAVATVSSYGMITAVNTGTATITARTSNGYVAYCTVTVSGTDDYGNSFGSAYNWTLTAGMTNTLNGAIEAGGDWDYFRFTAPTTGTYTFYTAGALDTMGYLYNSSQGQIAYNDDAVGGVDRNFKITYSLAAGQVYYLAVKGFGLVTGNYSLNITVPTGTTTVEPTGVSINRSSTVIAKGNSETLVALVLPENATNRTITWSTSNSSVVTVDIYGRITGVNIGTATITASAVNGRAAYCTVTVTNVDDYGNGFDDAYFWWTLTAGYNNSRNGRIDFNGDWDYFRITAPTTGTYTFYTTGNTDTVGYLYNSSRVQIAYNDDYTDRNFRMTYSLTANQVYYLAVRGFGSGTGDYNLNITVPTGSTTVDPTGITLNRTSTVISKGRTETLTATVLPSNATNKTVTWTTSNSSVASVNTSGTITGVNTGTATITARTTNGYTAYCTVTVTASDDYGNRFEDAYGWAISSSGTSVLNGSIEYNGDWDYFWFTPSSSGNYTIYTTGNTDTMGYLYDSSYRQIAYNDDTAGSANRNFTITYNLVANQRYYVAVKAFGSITGNYALNVATPGVAADDYGNSCADAYHWSLTAGSTHVKYGNIETAGDMDFFRCTAPTTGEYTFYTTGTTNTTGHLLNSSQAQIAYNDDGDSSSRNFKITYNLSANQVYYIAVKTYSGNTGAYALYITVPR